MFVTSSRLNGWSDFNKFYTQLVIPNFKQNCFFLLFIFYLMSLEHRSLPLGLLSVTLW